MVGWFHDNDCLVFLLGTDEPPRNSKDKTVTVDLNHSIMHFLEINMNSQSVVCFY